MVDGSCLYCRTLQRAALISGAEAVVSISHHDYRYLVADGLDQAGLTGDILLEPVSRNTAAAVCAGAMHILASRGDELVVVLPSDHVIDDDRQFLRAIQAVQELVNAGRIVTFGVRPLWPSPDYGYLKTGEMCRPGKNVYDLAAFTEKPDCRQAAEFIGKGYLWNSGIFAARASVLIDAAARHAPQVHEACRKAVDGASRTARFITLDGSGYGAAPELSFDRAVMEKCDIGAVSIYASGWYDAGTWQTLEQIGEDAGDGNRKVGDAEFVGSGNVFVYSPKRLTVALGVKDVTIVDTPDALLVAKKNALDSMEDVVQRLRDEERGELETPKRMARPWGHYDVIAENDGYKVKCVIVRPGQSLSLQFHYHRAEHWIVVAGTATVINGDKTYQVKVNESVFIPAGTIHRLENRHEDDLELVEVQTGKDLSEEDIVRLDDDYGRPAVHLVKSQRGRQGEYQPGDQNE